MDENTKIALEKQNPWWFGSGFYTGIDRLLSYPDIEKYLKTKEILLLLGARRTGKSILLYQIVDKLLRNKIKPESILFINLDEPLFQSKADNPVFLSELVEEYIAGKDIKHFYLFIDEIQNYTYWSQTIKTLYDTKQQIKLILTGSSSTLLQGKASIKLSGRYFHTAVSPLSFQEYMTFNGLKKARAVEKKQHIETYVKYGGFPRVVLEKDERLKQELLKNYFQTIYLKDIIYPHKLRNNKDVFDLLYFLMSNIGKLVSYTNIGKTLHIATDTVKEYVDYAEKAYLINTLTKYDVSVKKQLANNKKIYCVDTGLINAVSFKFSEDKGRLFENLVCMMLKKQDRDIYYHKENFECDFLIKEGIRIKEAIQVSLSLQDEQTRKREIKGLLEAMKKHSLKEGLIITDDESQTMFIDGRKIVVKPIIEWLDKLE